MASNINIKSIMEVYMFLFLLLNTPCLCFPLESQEVQFQFPENLQLQEEIKLSRKDLCPADKSSSFYRYHNSTKTCYKLGEQGPCGENTNMVFYSEVNSTVFGQCDCDFLASKLPLVFHPKSNKCFQVYSQAYCGPNEWLVFSEDTLEPICTEDVCRDALFLDSEDLSDDIVEFKGKCVTLYSKSSHCQADQIVTFVVDQVHPSCGKVEDSEAHSISMRTVYKARTLSCRPGSRRDVNGKCRRTVTGIKIPNDEA